MRALTLVPCLLAGYARFSNAQTSSPSSSSNRSPASDSTSTTAFDPTVTEPPQPPPQEVCDQCFLHALDPTTIAYSDTNNIIDSTLITTAIVTPHYWLYEDGGISSSSLETVIVTTFVPTTTNTTNGTDATVLAEDLTWDYSGTTLTYPTEHVIYSQFNLQPDCSLTETPLTITQTEITKVLFPVETGSAGVGNDVVEFLQGLPEFRAQFNGTNLQTCDRWAESGVTLSFPVPGAATATRTASASILPDSTSVLQAETKLPTTRSRLPIPYGPRTTPLQYYGSGNYTLSSQESGTGTGVHVESSLALIPVSMPAEPIRPTQSQAFEIQSAMSSFASNSGASPGTHTTVAMLTESTADARTTTVPRGTSGPPPSPPSNPSVTAPSPVVAPPGNSAESTGDDNTHVSQAPIQSLVQPSIQPPVSPSFQPSVQPPIQTPIQPSPPPTLEPPLKPTPRPPNSAPNPPASPAVSQAIPTPGENPSGNNPTNNNPSINSPNTNNPSNDNPNNNPSNSNPESKNPSNNPPQPGQSITIGAGPPIVITPAPSSQGGNQPGGIILGPGSTLLPGQSTVVNGVAVVLGPSGSSLVIGGSSTVAINPAPTPTVTGLPILNVGGAVITANPSGEFVIGPGTTLQPGGPALTISGTALSLGPSRNVVVVNGVTQTLVPGAAIAPAPAVLAVGSQTVTANPSGGFVIAPGKTLIPGGPALTVSGTTLSLGSSGSVAVINDVTQTLGSAGAAITPGPALLTIGTNTYTLMSSGGVTGFIIAPGTTLLPGSSIVVSGTTYSLPAAATGAGGPSVVVVNGHTSTLGTAPATNPAGPITAAPTLTIAGTTYAPTVSGGMTYYVIVPGTTLTPGGVVTVDGTRISLGPEGTALVIGGVTSYASRPRSAAATTTSIGVGDPVAGESRYSGAAGARSLGKRGGIEGLVERFMLGAVGIVIWVLH